MNFRALAFILRELRRYLEFGKKVNNFDIVPPIFGVLGRLP